MMSHYVTSKKCKKEWEEEEGDEDQEAELPVEKREEGDEQ